MKRLGLGMTVGTVACLAVDCMLPTACSSQTTNQTTTPDKRIGDQPVMVKVKRNVKDAEWTEFAARTVAMLPNYQPGKSQIKYSKYGGRLDRRTRATGFFRVEKQNDRWWLVDPEGYLFIHVGVTSLAPGNTPTPQAALKQKYQTRERWAENVTQWLWSEGFNGSGNWSTGPLLRTASRPLIYCANGPVDSPTAPPGTRAGFMNAFAKSKSLTRPGVGHSNYPNNCMPLFHPEFEPFLDEYAKPLAALKDDPYLLGYFSDNELPMPHLDKYLELNPEDPEMGSSYRHAQAWLDKRKGKSATPGDITAEDRSAWIEYAWEHYFAVTTKAIRKYDPNHLCLGPRLYGDEKRHKGAMQAAGRHLDVIGINDYFVWNPKPQDVARWTEWSGKPVMMTEWYAKGMDSGFPNTSGAGWTVPTQKDRGLFYQTYTLGLLESKNCVGWQWFKYMDNDQSDPKAEASNRDANKGMVTLTYEPYAPLLDEMRILNREVYTLTDYFDGKSKSSSPTRVRLP